MRIKIIIPVILFSFIFSGVAHAQITVLPKSDLSNDACRQVLNEFEINAKVPSVEDTRTAETESKVKAAQDEYNKIDANERAICEAKYAQCQADPGYKICMDCIPINQKKYALDQAQKAMNDENNQMDVRPADDPMNLLGCAIRTGRISLAMLPYFVTYFANYLLGIVGILVVLFIVLGGYFYIWGGLTEKKEKGKQYITHSLMGLAVASIAWILVNAVMALFTS